MRPYTRTFVYIFFQYLVFLWTLSNSNFLTGYRLVWTGANDIDQDGLYTFDIENSSYDLPFGKGTFDFSS